MNKHLFSLLFDCKIFFNILQIWIFSTVKDPNIGQGSQIETLILIIRLLEDYPTQGKELQSLSCCCNWSILKRVHTIWNHTKPNHPDEICFSTFMHLKFHLYSFLAADTMYTFGSCSAQAPLPDNYVPINCQVQKSHAHGRSKKHCFFSRGTNMNAFELYNL